MKSEMEPSKDAHKQGYTGSNSTAFNHNIQSLNDKTWEEKEKIERVRDAIQNQIVSEAQWWSTISIIIILLGILLIFFSVIMMIFNQNVTLGIVGGISGIVIDSFTILILKPSKAARDREDKTLNKIDKYELLNEIKEAILQTDNGTQEIFADAYIKVLNSINEPPTSLD